MEETLKQQLRKKILDLKADSGGFYTELYNLVAVMIKLNPDAFNAEISALLEKKLLQLYNCPSSMHRMALPQLEQLYFVYKNDPNVRIRARAKIDLCDVKKILDKVRRDLLFYLALVEDRPKDYDIVLSTSVKKQDGGI